MKRPPLPSPLLREGEVKQDVERVRGSWVQRGKRQVGKPLKSKICVLLTTETQTPQRKALR